MSPRLPSRLPHQQELTAQAKELRCRGTLLTLLDEHLGLRDVRKPRSGTPHISIPLSEQRVIAWQTGSNVLRAAFAEALLDLRDASLFLADLHKHPALQHHTSDSAH